jgi:peroxidase
MRLHEMFSKPDFYKNGESLNSVFRGLIKQPAKDKSCAIVDDVRNFLFTDPAKKEHRLDLFALNVQRSRDHGLPSYN